jgi:hypothetical protein
MSNGCRVPAANMSGRFDEHQGRCALTWRQRRSPIATCQWVVLVLPL